MFFLPACIQLFFADAADVRHVTEDQRRRFAGGIVIALVQAQVLPVTARIGRIDHHGVERVLQHLRVMHVGGGDKSGDGPAAGLGQQAAFCPRFGPICRVWARCAPLKRALPIEVSDDCHSNSTRPSGRA
jgi:hypothetical protein